MNDLDDGRPVHAHLAEARELAARGPWWRRLLAWLGTTRGPTDGP